MTTFSKLLLTTLILSIGSERVRADRRQRESEDGGAGGTHVSAAGAGTADRCEGPKATGSDELKEHALFVLGQIDPPEARTLLLETARTGSGTSGKRRFVRSASAATLPRSRSSDDLRRRRRGHERGRARSLPDRRLHQGRVRHRCQTQDAKEFENAVEKLGAMVRRRSCGRALARRRRGADQCLRRRGRRRVADRVGHGRQRPRASGRSLRALGITESDKASAILVDALSQLERARRQGRGARGADDRG